MENSYPNEQREQQLTDKGWAAMQTLLDRELPQERRRRRAGGWWSWLAALLLLPLLAGATWWLQRQPEAAPEAKPAPAETPAAPTTTPPVATLPEDGITPSGQPSEQKMTAATNAAAKATPAPGTVTSQNIPGPTQPRTAQQPRSVANGPAGQQWSHPVATTPSPAPATTTATNTEVAILAPSPTPATATAPLPSRSLSTEPGLPVALTNRSEPTLKPVDPNALSAISVKACCATPRWAIGATAGVLSQALPRVNSATAGFTVDFILRQRLGLRSGLNYRYQYAGSGNRAVARIQDSVYAETTGQLSVLDYPPGNTFNPAGSVEAAKYILIPVRDQHRLEIPLSIFWEPVRNLRVYSGASASYLLYSKAEGRAYAEGVEDVVSVASLNDRVSSEVYSLISGDLPHWQFDARFALGYRIGQRLELGLSYQHPLQRSSAKTDAAVQYNPTTGMAESTSLSTDKSTARPSFGLSGTLFF